MKKKGRSRKSNREENGISSSEISTEMLAKRRLIEEGLSAQRQKRSKLEAQNASAKILEKNEQETKLKESARRELHQILFHNQQQSTCYPCVKGSTANPIRSHPSLRDFLTQLRGKEIYNRPHYQTWKIHHMDYLAALSFLHNRMSVKQAFESRVNSICFHPEKGYLLGSIDNVIHFNPHTQFVYNLPISYVSNLSWSPNATFFVVHIEHTRSIALYQLVHEDPYFAFLGVSANDFIVCWLQDDLCLAVGEKSMKVIQLNSVSRSTCCLNEWKLPKNTFVSAIIPLVNNLELGSLSSKQFLFGLRNGGIAFVELSDIHSERLSRFIIFNRMPARVQCLYQFQYNPNQYLAKDVTGRIAIFDLRPIITNEDFAVSTANEVVIIREGNQTILDTSGVWISQHEEVIVTSSIYSNKPEKQLPHSDLAVYSLRRNFSCLHETILKISENSKIIREEERKGENIIGKKLIPFNLVCPGLPFACVVNFDRNSYLLTTD